MRIEPIERVLKAGHDDRTTYRYHFRLKDWWLLTTVHKRLWIKHRTPKQYKILRKKFPEADYIEVLYSRHKQLTLFNDTWEYA